MAAQLALYGGLAALEVVGGYYASQNIKATAQLNREISDMNAQFAELDAYDAEIEGYNKTTRYQSVVDATLAEQQVKLTAADIDVNYGSAASIQKETRFQAELNKMEIEKDAQQQALGYKRQSRDYRLKGTLDFGAEQARASATMFKSGMKAAELGLTGYSKES